MSAGLRHAMVANMTPGKGPLAGRNNAGHFGPSFVVPPTRSTAPPLLTQLLRMSDNRCCCQRRTRPGNSFQIASLVVVAALQIYNFATDIGMVLIFRKEGSRQLFKWSVTFLAIPSVLRAIWAMYLFFSALDRHNVQLADAERTYRTSFQLCVLVGVPFLMSLAQMDGLLHTAVAVSKQWESKDLDLPPDVSMARVIELLFQTLPQLFIQCYVLQEAWAFDGSVPTLLIMSMTGSILSVAVTSVGMMYNELKPTNERFALALFGALDAVLWISTRALILHIFPVVCLAYYGSVATFLFICIVGGGCCCSGDAEGNFDMFIGAPFLTFGLLVCPGTFLAAYFPRAHELIPLTCKGAHFLRHAEHIGMLVAASSLKLLPVSIGLCLLGCWVIASILGAGLDATSSQAHIKED